ncbi:putative bifunctional diguanylate cyclase/phosphodiesterase [Phreatobacter stygius]|uniref:Bifunctional diguanylate cyclase/phosphodiesterase n=1 Tax=Phreatobacter stygius TaxID=1940610 RepID=A0A4D7BES6_9HYPH|nr:bifunctional diguanylate cyclase/phosphodiesterase [Phreatobacter stygius]QCI68943.1 bifunctional diguanylate cyclase/phosphodiesterase [Phreatobacter stygius]
MSASIKRSAYSALSRHVWAVGAAIALSAAFMAAASVLAWFPARLAWQVDQTWFGRLAAMALMVAGIALVLLVRLRLVQAEVIQGARFLSPVGIDDLTGLSNRAAFYRAFERALDGLAERRAFTLVLLDLDHFKEINDSHGHHAGDVVLAQVGRRLRQVCGPEPEIARLGGDEFAIIISASSAPAHVLTACALISAEIAKPVTVDGKTLNVGVSMGFLQVDRPSGDRDDLMRQADRALYAAKERGRGCAIAYDVEMDKDVAQRRFFERELRGAVLTGEIDVHLQPILTADGETLVGMEALARWNHSYRGAIMPGEFIRLAEETGLIHQLGNIVLQRACRAAARWPGLFISVNVSPVQMRRPDFPDVVMAVLGETGLEPGRLVLEVTESVMIDDPEKALVALRSIRDLGVQIALDDFGTGFSSLSYLRKFPIDKLKVDRSFVLDLDKGAEAATILHCVINLGRALGLRVIAEGVETVEHARFLRAAGCHEMQGYLFGRPMPVTEFEAIYGLAPAPERAVA